MVAVDMAVVVVAVVVIVETAAEATPPSRHLSSPCDLGRPTWPDPWYIGLGRGNLLSAP